MDAGEEPVHHSAELELVRRQARRVRAQSVAIATALTGLAVLLAWVI